MAEPNPDDGLVPEISELYKRNPAEWTREAERRTRLEATVAKLEELESTKDEDDEEKANIDSAASVTHNSSEKEEDENSKKESSSDNAKPSKEPSENKRKFKKLKTSK
jgi:ubiquitin-conjugating enzyme E2 T